MARIAGNSLVGSTGINGDALFATKDLTTMLLCDGASGAGKMGKVMMTRACVDTVQATPFRAFGFSGRDYIDRMIHAMNDELIAISREQGALTFGTVSLGVIDGASACIATVGDSPAYLVQRGRIARVAQPQRRYQNLVDAGVMTAEEAERHIRTLPDSMWSLFDVFLPSVIPAYGVAECTLTPGDRIIFCSDGVSDFVTPKEIMAQADTPEAILTLAKTRAMEDYGHYDDCTILIYTYT